MSQPEAHSLPPIFWLNVLRSLHGQFELSFVTQIYGHSLHARSVNAILSEMSAVLPTDQNAVCWVGDRGGAEHHPRCPIEAAAHTHKHDISAR